MTTQSDAAALQNAIVTLDAAITTLQSGPVSSFASNLQNTVSAIALVASLGAALIGDVETAPQPPATTASPLTGTLFSSLVPVTSDPLTITVTLGGIAYTFSETSGTNLGTFTNQYFSHNVIKCTVTGCPIQLYIKHDLTGNSRAEVVSEYAYPFATWTTGAPDIGTFTVMIQQDGKALQTITAPHHWMYARWRWQSSPRSIIMTPAALVAKGLLFPIGPVTGIPAGVSYGWDPTNTSYQNPMDMAGLTGAMPMTGGRNDIGPITDVSAACIYSFTTANLLAVLCEAEACGSIPVHWRDLTTNAPVDMYANPLFTDAGPATLPLNTAQNPTGWNLDNSHFPNACWLAWLLTQDSYYLEEMQFHMVYWYSQPNYFAGLMGTGHIAMYQGQQRDIALGVGLLYQISYAMQQTTSLPSSMLPMSQYTKFRADDVSYQTTTYVNSTLPAYALFDGNQPNGQNTAPFECDYLLMREAQAVMLGFSERQPMLEFRARQILSMTNPSVWKIAYCTGYSFDFSVATSWAQEWTIYNATNPAAAITTVDYLATRYAALAYIACVPGAHQSQAKSQLPAIESLYISTGQPIDVKWSMVAA
jgi:hypothetical protein